MKLLFVIDSLGSGGAQRQMVTLARALKIKGHQIEFFIYYPEYHFKEILDEVEIPISCYTKSSRFSITPIFALWKKIRSGYFDAVLAFLDTPNFYSEVACLPIKNVKLIVSERASNALHKPKIWKLLLYQCHRLADFITVNSHHHRIWMETQFNWIKPKIRTIYNGYDLDVFSSQAHNLLNKSGLSLIAISSVSFNKNTLNLARAIKICRDSYNLIVLVDWVGATHVSTDGLRPLVETDFFLKDSNLKSQWRWLGVRTDIQKLIVSHAALIHPSHSEGLPNVICEALACGRPVLASRVGDHPLLIDDQVYGYLFDQNSPDDIAKAIFLFSQRSTSERKTMGILARRFAEHHLSLECYVVEYENLFKSIL